MAQDLKIIKTYVFVRFYVFLELDLSLWLYRERKSSLELIIGGVKVFVKVHHSRIPVKRVKALVPIQKALVRLKYLSQSLRAILSCTWRLWGVLGFRLK